MTNSTKHSRESVQEKEPFIFADIDTLYGEDDECEEKVKGEGTASKSKAEDRLQYFHLHFLTMTNDSIAERKITPELIGIKRIARLIKRYLEKFPENITYTRLRGN